MKKIPVFERRRTQISRTCRYSTFNTCALVAVHDRDNSYNSILLVTYSHTKLNGVISYDLEGLSDLTCLSKFSTTRD